MIPLCTSAMRAPLFAPPGPAEKCGCALSVVGAPCVAQRVCAMPVKPGRLAVCASSSATRETLRARLSMPSACTATPQES